MRVRALIIVAGCGLLGLAGSGCSLVLGIEDPTADSGDDDIPPPGADRVTLNLAEVQIAQLQRVRLRVTAVYPDGSMQDATASATYESDNGLVAAVETPGQLDAGAQAGSATITVRLGTARPASMPVTVTSKTCRPVINEFLTEGMSAADDWVEILNPCTEAIDVSGWTLAYRGSGTATGPDSNLLASLTGLLQPGDLRLFAGTDYSGRKDGVWANGLGETNGAIALRAGPLSTGMIVDGLVYSGTAVTTTHPFLEGGTQLPAMAVGLSAARLPFDGHDQNKGTDFMRVTTPTPDAPNVP